MCMMLEITYFHDELVQLIVSRSDSEQEVQRYGMKKNTLTVDPIMLPDELWMRQCEKLSPNRRSRFLLNRTTENRVFGFWVLRSVRFGSVFRKRISEISSDSAHPYKTINFVLSVCVWASLVACLFPDSRKRCYRNFKLCAHVSSSKSNPRCHFKVKMLIYI